MQPHQPSSWRREPWPWLLMVGPVTVVLAGIVTCALAFSGADGLVADDYYRQGLGINRTLTRDAAARALRVRGNVSFEPGTVRATLGASRALPDRIRLTLVHATRAGEDRVVTLARDASGVYTAPLSKPPAGRWSLVLETPEWRVASGADLRSRSSVAIGAAN